MNNTVFAYVQLMRLDKPIGTLLLLWPTLWALWLTGKPTVPLLIIFTLGVFLMRAAGCVINDIADRKFDSHVERTKNRPLASGRVDTQHALMLFIILISLAVILLVTLPSLTWLIACFALLTTLIYPFMKRYSHLPQLVLGIAFSWGIPMAYVAAIGSLPVSCWLLCIANICWTIAYDTQYAMVDRNDDLKIGLKSTAILFGRYDKLIIGLLQLMMLVLLIIIAISNHLTLSFYLGLIASAALFIYQQYLIADRQRAPCFNAFRNNNLVGLSIFMGLFLSYL